MLIIAVVLGFILSIHSHYLQLVVGGRRKNLKMPILLRNTAFVARRVGATIDEIVRLLLMLEKILGSLIEIVILLLLLLLERISLLLLNIVRL